MPILIAIVVIGTVVAFMAISAPMIFTGYERGSPIQVKCKPIGNGLYLREDAADSFLAMCAAAKTEGIDIRPSGPRAAFRTTEQQQSLQIDRADFAAPVNFSPHQTGRAIDLETEQGTNAAYRWLCVNGAAFGFFSTVSREPWHWEFFA